MMESHNSYVYNKATRVVVSQGPISLGLSTLTGLKGSCFLPREGKAPVATIGGRIGDAHLGATLCCGSDG